VTYQNKPEYRLFKSDAGGALLVGYDVFSFLAGCPFYWQQGEIGEPLGSSRLRPGR
jgi:hypothetical protein